MKAKLTLIIEEILNEELTDEEIKQYSGKKMMKQFLKSCSTKDWNDIIDSGQVKIEFIKEK